MSQVSLVAPILLKPWVAFPKTTHLWAPQARHEAICCPVFILTIKPPCFWPFLLGFVHLFVGGYLHQLIAGGLWSHTSLPSLGVWPVQALHLGFGRQKGGTLLGSKLAQKQAWWLFRACMGECHFCLFRPRWTRSVSLMLALVRTPGSVGRVCSHKEGIATNQQLGRKHLSMSVCMQYFTLLCRHTCYNLVWAIKSLLTFQHACHCISVWRHTCYHLPWIHFSLN